MCIKTAASWKDVISKKCCDRVFLSVTHKDFWIFNLSMKEFDFILINNLSLPIIDDILS